MSARRPINTNSHRTRHTSSCMCVGFSRSPQSLTDVSSWGFTASPPSCNSNYLGYIPNFFL
ncbi:hypothetical protein EG332_11795 [Pectobacterium versatile]|nr:hypothetical protein EG332_11795 [Pectobacterium versatile]